MLRLQSTRIIPTHCSALLHVKRGHQLRKLHVNSVPIQAVQSYSTRKGRALESLIRAQFSIIQCLLHYICLRISAIQLYTKQLLKPNFSKWEVAYAIKNSTAKTNSNGSSNIWDPCKDQDDCWHVNIFWQAVPTKKTGGGIILIYSRWKKKPPISQIHS